MGFDGLPRPAQLHPLPTDSLNPYMAANLARQEENKAPRIREPDKDDPLRSLPEERHDTPSSTDDDDARSAFSEEEAEAIRTLAKVRGILNFSFESGKRYEFRLNPQSSLIDLIALETGDIVLQLTPEEMLRFSQKIARYAGMLADKAG